MRYKVTLEFMVEADTKEQSIANGQKLADILNAKDPRNKASVKKMVKKS